MQMIFHGGKCCGIWTIFNLGAQPEHDHGPIRPHAITISGHEYPALTRQNVGAISYAAPGQRAHYPARPQESGEARLTAYCAYSDKLRPSGLLELSTSEGGYPHQTPFWAPLLLALGFKEVTKFTNSNSGAVVTVWHRTVKEGKVV